MAVGVVLACWGVLGHLDAQSQQKENRQAALMDELCRLKSAMCRR